MRIYLDNCCLQRPLDDQTQPRIRVETEAVFVILAAVQAGNVALVGSEVLDYEVSGIPDDARRSEVRAVLAFAKEHLLVTDDVEKLALDFEGRGLQSMDSLHLALASVAKADVFCSCDDQLLKKAQTFSGLSCRVVSLLSLVSEVTQ